MFGQSFRGKRVWLSGHTGFKGSWLAEWLLLLGAEVYGYALEYETSPALFSQLCLKNRLHHLVADIRDREAVKKSILQTTPDFVFHLAAQPLVRRSYAQPTETYETNVNGTINVLEALRSMPSPCTAVFVTTDKCYENREHGLPYKEEDHLGGFDPYSSSKAMAEIAISAYRRSYFESSDSLVQVMSARAGNVIGGGDWAEDRIVPDSIRALEQGLPIPIRNRFAIRPWQHVLEPLSGYLWLAASRAQGGNVPAALNFGPKPDCARCVQDLVGEILTLWTGTWEDHSDARAVHEAKLLTLCIQKAAATIQWQPVWNFETTIAKTVGWYRSVHVNQSPQELTVAQIRAYFEDARIAGLSWTH